MIDSNDDIKRLVQMRDAAPSYCRPFDDDANWSCVECGIMEPADKCRMVFTPDGRQRVICDACIDPDWLANATDMGSF